ncbi:hypothetical protein MVEN_02258900 [Mycena venus]|uniref:Uncharacterized protein n=1 Tax=Mycena venus TaxID=2733690 RepID=A0A8H7CH00_9AGAR|nr:hypothetical protein MVEN_02258900 [Mycena venus]
MRRVGAARGKRARQTRAAARVPAYHSGDKTVWWATAKSKFCYTTGACTTNDNRDIGPTERCQSTAGTWSDLGIPQTWEKKPALDLRTRCQMYMLSIYIPHWLARLSLGYHCNFLRVSVDRPCRYDQGYAKSTGQPGMLHALLPLDSLLQASTKWRTYSPQR